MNRAMDPSQLRALYLSNTEFALIDPREELVFSRGHLFAATNLPFSRLELTIHKAVPLLETRIILCDDDGLVSKRAADLLGRLGYGNVEILAGGVSGWQLAGGAVFSGSNVPSKTFGEWIEHQMKTPTISARQLQESLDQGDKIVLLDARPMAEHSAFCIPGSVSCPAGEMVFRSAAIPCDKDTKLVVHCAGRTRSIIGTQTLIDSGLFPSVSSLCDGTPAWEFLSADLQYGNEQSLPTPPFEDNETARQVARRQRQEWSIPQIAPDEIEDWKSKGGTRYIFDIRTIEEFCKHNIAGSEHVSGGQLIQTLECHIVVQKAHVALVDSDGVRAVTTAVWLRRMGLDNVVTVTLSGKNNLPAPRPTHSPQIFAVPTISPEKAADMVSSANAMILDIRPANQYQRSHLEGAGYFSRADLERDVKALPPDKTAILYANDRPYAELVARDLHQHNIDALLLEESLDNLQGKGWAIATGQEWLISPPIDTYLLGDHFEERLVSLREKHAYLSWERTLLDHIVGEPAVRFRISPDP